MTRQEFDEAYDNGYKHGYAAGRSDSDTLDKIQAEIEEQIERDFAFAKTEEVKVPVHYGTANGLQVAVRIINKYRKGQTDADSD